MRTLAHEKSLERVRELEHELREANAEIARHHRDFEQVRQVAHTALAVDSAGEAVRALRDIIGIVG